MEEVILGRYLSRKQFEMILGCGFPYIAVGSGPWIKGKKRIAYLVVGFTENGKPGMAFYVKRQLGDATRGTPRIMRRLFGWRFPRFKKHWKIRLGVHQNLRQTLLACNPEAA